MKQIYRSKILASVVFLLLGLSAFAQRHSVKGKITDTSGNPLPGVNIVLKGSTIGTTTDASGTYSLEAEPNDILVMSFIGYTKTEILVGNQTELSVTLQEDVATLQEVVIVDVGYGSVKRSDLTGSITSVK